MDALRTLRSSNGLSQYQMALALGVSLSLYEKVERGATRPSRNFVRRVWTYFPDADVNDLFYAENSN